MVSPAAAVQQAENWLPFLERVGLPYALVLIMLLLMVSLVWLFVGKLLVELREIVKALTELRIASVGLTAEVRQNTPVHGTPIEKKGGDR